MARKRRAIETTTGEFHAESSFKIHRYAQAAWGHPSERLGFHGSPEQGHLRDRYRPFLEKTGERPGDGMGFPDGHARGHSTRTEGSGSRGHFQTDRPLQGDGVGLQKCLVHLRAERRPPSSGRNAGAHGSLEGFPPVCGCQPDRRTGPRADQGPGNRPQSPALRNRDGATGCVGADWPRWPHRLRHPQPHESRSRDARGACLAGDSFP